MDRLTNTIRPYAWGSTTAIPTLLGVEPTGEPQAEMWMGAHPGAPSRVDRGAGETALSDVIAADPEGELGAATVAKFGPRLPFLLKILAAGAPLSLQVHPDRTQARAGFEDEERRGVPIDAGHRNYKDPNHKPEMLCALTAFDGLCGFRPPQQSADLLEGLGVDSLKPYADLLRAHPEDAALREMLTAVLTADREQMARTVHEVAAAVERLGGPYAPYATLVHEFPGDPGVIAAMLLNHFRLQPGEAVFLGAGVPHAYIQGLGVELLANSDNVLRAGLTPKHVDVPELMKIVKLESDDPHLLRPEGDAEEVYETPIDEFRLSRYLLAPGGISRVLPEDTPQILLCTAGSPRVGELALAPGDSVFVPAGEKAELSGTGTVFRATVVV
ncbi:mannose-6-phosphate isomerase, class I [Streptomyces sp. NPDC056224]|uniref:mannose-6-phosphate isomerase, class I n=1 Tax=Streptomyces sp. NPDC056224 TaxID=3345750 RepID=UPI0035DA1DB2